MFFWMFLASFMGIIMFGDFLDNTKSEEVFVAPVYEAFALNMLQQHNAAYYAYQDIQNIDLESLNDSIEDDSGINPLVTVEDGTMSGVSSSNEIFPYIEKRLPLTFKPQSGTRTYLYCIDKNQSTQTSCSNVNAVRYIMTIRMIPPRYDGSNKTSVLNALGTIVEGSRSAGLLQKAPTPLSSSANTQYQPFGAQYLVLSAGVAPVDIPYIPNYILCNTPLDNNDPDKTLGDEGVLKNNSFLAVLTLISGLSQGENLPQGSIASSCPALQ